MAIDLTKTQLVRLMEMDRQLRAGKYPNCDRLARRFELSRKTMLRDIEWLRDRQKAPIAYDYTKRGYYYTDPTWSFQAVNLTESELIQLMLVRQMAGQLTGTPLAGTVDSLLKKLNAAADQPVTVDPLILRQQVSFHSAPSRRLNEAVWTAVLKALRSDQVLEIEYQSLDSMEPFTRVVEPIHLACVEGDWYLIAHDRERAAVRHFALSRMKSACVTQEQFGFRAFDPDAYFGNRFGRYIGEKGHVEFVQLRFNRKVASAVLERPWHPRQTVKTNRDGSVVLSFPAPERLVVVRWVLQWGEYVKVIKPKGLAEAVRATARKLLAMYSR